MRVQGLRPLGEQPTLPSPLRVPARCPAAAPGGLTPPPPPPVHPPAEHRAGPGPAPGHRSRGGGGGGRCFRKDRQRAWSRGTAGPAGPAAVQGSAPRAAGAGAGPGRAAGGGEPGRAARLRAVNAGASPALLVNGGSVEDGREGGICCCPLASLSLPLSAVRLPGAGALNALPKWRHPAEIESAH